MKRRTFIQNTGTVVSLPMLFPGINVQAHSMPLAFADMASSTDRVLVLIRLNGGNDGLNTIVPIDQIDNLMAVRRSLAIPSSRVIKATNTLGFHPAMTGIKTLFDRGECKIVQSVGYPDQNRSHFRSMDIWTSGRTDRDGISSSNTTGWLGRHLDRRNPGFPTGYPNADNPDPFALSMGFFTSETCQGQAANFSLSLSDPFSLSPIESTGSSNTGGAYFQEEAKFVRMIMSQTGAYGSAIQKAASRGANSVSYPGTDLAKQLKNVARLISGGLRTHIYVVSIGKFDTHGNQVSGGSSTKGLHADLLKTVADAVLSFQSDLRKQGHDQRTLTMTFSEFGRQIGANDSLGTDHGDAAPLMVFGPCVNPNVLGSNPKISRRLAPQEGVPMQIDFRDVYGTVLEDWFGVPDSAVRNILHSGYTRLPLISGCGAAPADNGPTAPPPPPTNEPEPAPEEPTSPDPAPSGDGAFEVRLAPNPCDTYFRIRFTANDRERCSITIVNSQGGLQLKRLDNIRVPGGNRTFKIDCSNWRQDTYYVTVELETQGVATSSILKM